MENTDKNYWKDRYQSLWGASTEREAKIAAMITEATGHQVDFVGLGAGSSEYIEGAAADRGLTKGGADLKIKDLPVYIEVTGPLVRTVTPDQPLWIRPDKVEAARSHIADQETWVVHHLPHNDLIRVVSLNADFMKRLDSKEFGIVHPVIRGTQETYVEIPASDVCVQDWDQLIARIKGVIA